MVVVVVGEMGVWRGRFHAVNSSAIHQVRKLSGTRHYTTGVRVQDTVVDGTLTESFSDRGGAVVAET